MAPATARKRINPVLKLVLEMGPLGLFFLANARPALFVGPLAPLLPGVAPGDPTAGIFAATAAFMVASIASLAVHYALTRHLAIMPLVSGIVVLVFGGLTLWLHDETFIKMKPTIINALFGTILLGGLAFGRPLVAYVLDAVVDLTPEGWRILTLRWGLFFLFLAAANEVAWRTLSTDAWVNWKVFGTFPLTMIFVAFQVPLLMRHEAGKANPPGSA